MYETSDFLTAAFLSAKGQHIKNTERTGKRVIFMFDDKNECESLAKDLLHGNDNVSATNFFNSIKRLKKIIYSNDV